MDANERMAQVFAVLDAAEVIKEEQIALVEKAYQDNIREAQALLAGVMQTINTNLIQSTYKPDALGRYNSSSDIKANAEGVSIKWTYSNEFDGDTFTKHFFPWNELISFKDEEK